MEDNDSLSAGYTAAVDPDEAAIRVQAVARGRLARKRPSVVAARTAKEDREKAAVKIQAVHRSKAVRVRQERAGTQEEAAVKIQALQRQRVQWREAVRQKMGGFPLTKGHIRGGLSLLGRNPFTLTHCYIKLSAPGSCFTDLKAIKEFPFLQHVDLHNNKIKDPMPLAALPFLITLNLKGNLLEETPNFDSYAGVKDPLPWNTYPLIGSMLHEVDLSDNRIARLGDFSAHRFVRTLHLDGNRIREIRGLDQCKQLQVLTLSRNEIGVIRGLDALPLTSLDLSHNRLEHLHNLGKLPRLQRLSLVRNRVRLLSGLRQCRALRELDLRGNAVAAVRQVEFLQGMPLLHTLVLEDNPVCELPFFRLRVLVRLQLLTRLNRTGVSPEEKVKAVNFHGGPDSDLKNRELSFKKHFPNEKFVNTVEPFVEPEGEPEVDDTPEYIAPALAESLAFHVGQYLARAATRHLLARTGAC